MVGAGCRLTVPETLPDLTLIFGKNCTRKVSSDKPPVRIHKHALPCRPSNVRLSNFEIIIKLLFQSQHLQREFLAKVLPNYHHLKKSKTAVTQSANQALK